MGTTTVVVSFVGNGSLIDDGLSPSLRRRFGDGRFFCPLPSFPPFRLDGVLAGFMSPVGAYVGYVGWVLHLVESEGSRPTSAPNEVGAHHPPASPTFWVEKNIFFISVEVKIGHELAW